MEAERGTVVLYQPQPESFEGNELKARAAVSVALKDETEPRFGAVWLTSRVATDRDSRTVEIEDVSITGVRFPDVDEESQQALASFLEHEIPRWGITISLDRLLTSLEVVEEVEATAGGLNNTPPKIIFMDRPAILVSIDGEPQMTTIEDSKLMRVINTPFTIVFDSNSKKYYLDGGDVWYAADEAVGPFAHIDAPPPAVEAAVPEPPPEEQAAPVDPEEEEEEEKDTRIPEIVVATAPTELIVSDGKPTYTPLPDIDLLYMSNTENDVLLEVDTQRYFVLLSGRWYASKSLDGPWTYVAPGDLPDSFAEISIESEMGHLRVWVPGTDEANDAVMDNQIPQTAAIKRDEAHLTVTYDGKPKFEKIDETGLKYAVNTETSVIQSGKKYYACDQAVWFVADDPLGPWIVADEIPKEIYSIPASSPVYNVKYVYIYDSTPEIVYIGYYPGYFGSYIYQGTVVYGTGYLYQPWYSTYHYYSRPATWGFGIRWNPWSGWSFGLSWTNGPFRISIGFGGWGRGWWGPRGWRGYGRGYSRGWHHGYRAGARAGYRAGQRNSSRSNIYNRPSNQNRVADRQRPTGERPAAKPATDRANNVYTDRDGNVFRKTDDGWQQREGRDWKNSEGGADRGGASTGGTSRPESGSKPAAGAGTQDRTRPSGGSNLSRPSGSGSSQQLNRDHNARQRGSSRTSSFQGSRGGGGSRSRPSGGGRRR
jgi:hypothetical protein